MCTVRKNCRIFLKDKCLTIAVSDVTDVKWLIIEYLIIKIIVFLQLFFFTVMSLYPETYQAYNFFAPSNSIFSLVLKVWLERVFVQNRCSSYNEAKSFGKLCTTTVRVFHSSKSQIWHNIQYTVYPAAGSIHPARAGKIRKRICGFENVKSTDQRGRYKLGFMQMLGHKKNSNCCCKASFRPASKCRVAFLMQWKKSS